MGNEFSFGLNNNLSLGPVNPRKNKRTSKRKKKGNLEQMLEETSLLNQSPFLSFGPRNRKGKDDAPEKDHLSQLRNFGQINLMGPLKDKFLKDITGKNTDRKTLSVYGGDVDKTLENIYKIAEKNDWLSLIPDKSSIDTNMFSNPNSLKTLKGKFSNLLYKNMGNINVNDYLKLEEGLKLFDNVHDPKVKKSAIDKINLVQYKKDTERNRKLLEGNRQYFDDYLTGRKQNEIPLGDPNQEPEPLINITAKDVLKYGLLFSGQPLASIMVDSPEIIPHMLIGTASVLAGAFSRNPKVGLWVGNTLEALYINTGLEESYESWVTGKKTAVKHKDGTLRELTTQERIDYNLINTGTTIVTSLLGEKVGNEIFKNKQAVTFLESLGYNFSENVVDNYIKKSIGPAEFLYNITHDNEIYKVNNDFKLLPPINMEESLNSDFRYNPIDKTTVVAPTLQKQLQFVPFQDKYKKRVELGNEKYFEYDSRDLKYYPSLKLQNNADINKIKPSSYNLNNSSPITAMNISSYSTGSSNMPSQFSSNSQTAGNSGDSYGVTAGNVGVTPFGNINIQVMASNGINVDIESTHPRVIVNGYS